MSEMVSAAVESEKKDEPMNLSQVSPKAQQEAFGFAMANNPNPTPPPSSGAGEIPGELGALNETIGASSVAPSSIAPGEPGNNPHPQRKVSMAPPTMPMGMAPTPPGLPGQAPKQTSELAKILGNKEMSQLEKMSRLHSNNPTPYSNSGPMNHSQSPGMSPQISGSPQIPNSTMSPTPGNPGMTRPNGPAGMMPQGMHGMHPGGPGFGQQFGSFPPNHPGMMGQGTNFRFPPGPMRHPGPGFGGPDQSHITSPASTPPVVEPSKPSAKRNRRPSRKNSRDGAEEEGRAKKRGKKDPSEGPPKRKRPPKKTAVGGVIEGHMYMFSTEMLNDAAKGLDSPKLSNLVQYHQSKYTGNQPQRIQPKMTPNTTPPVPSASQLGHMPGHQRPMPHHRMSPGMNPHMANPMSPMNPGGMSPGMGNHVMSPLGPHRVPTPQQDGRPITPGSTSSRMGIGPNPPASPALSQDARIPQSPAPVPSPMAAQSTTPTPATPTPGETQQPPAPALTPQMTPTTEEVKLKDQSATMNNQSNSTPNSTANPTSQNANPEPNTLDTLREIQSEKKDPSQETPANNQMTPGTPSTPTSVNQVRPNSFPENHDMIQNMIDQQKMNPLQQPPASMQQPMHPQQPQHPGHHQQPGHHPGMHPGMHPNMQRFPYNGHGPPGYHPGMPRGPAGQMPYNAHMMHQMRHRMPPGMSYEQMAQMRLPYGQNPMMRPHMMRFPNRGMMPNSNQMPYSEQLRQQAAMYSNPQQGPPGMNFPNGPQNDNRHPYSAPQENGGFGNHPQGMPNHPGQGMPNGMGMNNYPSSYSPSAQHQGQPRGMMSPSPITPNPHMGQTGPQTTPMNVPGPPGTPSAPQNPAIDSPYPNQAKSPANSLVNGPIHSPSPSQGGTPSIPPSVPEMHPSTPQGMPLSPAHTNPMTPVSVPPQAPHTPGAPMTPSDPNSFAGTPNQAPLTPGGTAIPHGQPMTPGNPTTPGMPVENMDNNGTPVVSQMMPCSPMTPQGQQGPFSPHNHPPNGLLPDSSDISSFLQEPQKNPSIPPMSMGMSMPPQQHGYPGFPGPRQMHPGMGGMNHPGMSMGNRMMGMNPPMMTNQGMSGHHGYGQGGYPSWRQPYH